MIEVFADTAYWVAVQMPDDQHHRKAVDAVGLLPDGVRLVTSEFVMIEFLNYLTKAGHTTREEAAVTWKNLQESQAISYIASNFELIQKSRQLYEKMSDKIWSFTDCSSFVIMQERKIASALTTDRHFVQAGFRALMVN